MGELVQIVLAVGGVLGLFAWWGSEDDRKVARLMREQWALEREERGDRES